MTASLRTWLLLPFAAAALATPILPTPALANYSCEPGQPNCVPMDQYGNKKKHGERRIACRVDGEPVASPDDLRFRNVGTMTIAAGTLVKWSLPHTGESGVHDPAHPAARRQRARARRAGRGLRRRHALQGGVPQHLTGRKSPIRKVKKLLVVNAGLTCLR